MDMEQNHSCPKKWEAKVCTKLEKATSNQIWPQFQDFFGLNKWFPGLATCHGIHGTNGEIGCIRYCSGFGLKSENSKDNDSNDQERKKRWSKEKLVAMDSEKMTFSYEIVDSNIGFKSYVSTIKVVPDGDGGGCAVEWLISLEPVAGWKLEDLVVKYEVALQLMAKKMEDATISQTSFV